MTDYEITNSWGEKSVLGEFEVTVRAPTASEAVGMMELATGDFVGEQYAETVGRTISQVIDEELRESNTRRRGARPR